MSIPLKVFCCSAREDEKMLGDLIKHLTLLQESGKVIIWSDLNLIAGIDQAKERRAHLESADIILLLSSPEFHASDSCRDEMERALTRSRQGEAHVIPILLRPTLWEDAPFAELKTVPTGAKPITSWPNRDEAFRDVAQQVGKVIKELQKRQGASSSPLKTREREQNLASLSVSLDEKGNTPASTLLLARDEEANESGLPLLTLIALLNELAEEQNEQTLLRAYNHLCLLTTATIEHALGALLNPMEFPNLQKFALGLKQAYMRIREDSVTNEVHLIPFLGAIGLVCFTVELLNISRQQNQNVSLIDLDWPKTLIKDPAVWHWFKKVYQPSHNPAILQQNHSKELVEENLKGAEKHWQELHFDALELYCVGTTSFILRCHSRMLAGSPLILKCLLFPYTCVPEIVKATRSYALDYPAGKVPATAGIRASTDKWILMDEVAGITLREFVQKRRAINAQKPRLLDIDALVSLGEPLLTALETLFHAGYHHGDLTPSNIMIIERNATVERIVFIDLGRNYLYTRDIGLEARREAIFVAPEVKDGKDAEETSDLYSFGMILIELADPNGAVGGTIPDNLYRYAPDLARFIEDLIDAKPENRRWLYPLSDRNNPYAGLQNIFTNILKLLPSEREVRSGNFQIEQYIALFYPGYQLAHARELRRMARTSSAHPAIARQASWLYGWLVVSLIIRWLVFGVAIAWGVRDFGITAFPVSIITDVQALIPVPNYHFGVENLPARLITFSVGLMQIFYPNIFAGLAPRSMSGPLAGMTEFFLRFVTFVAFPMALIGNLIRPDWWLLWLSIGLSTPALTQILCHRLAVSSLRKARRVLSSVPHSTLDDVSLKTFGRWGISLSCYVMVLFILWCLFLANLLHDYWVYTALALFVNTLFLSIDKCIHLAPNVRGSLCRAFTLGERLEYLRYQTGDEKRTP